MFPRLFTIPAFPAFGAEWGPFTLHTYGVLLAVAFLAGLFVAHWQAKRAGLDAARIADMAVYVLIAGLVGAKLMLVAVEWPTYSRMGFWELLRALAQSGGVFYGGLLGGLFVAFYFARRYRLPAWSTADALAPGVVIGQAIGRLGCFAAGCCYGKAATVPWAVTFGDVYAYRQVGTPLDTPLHPSQVYEALATLVIFALLVWLAPRKGFDGQVTLAYVTLYSLARFGLEYFRGDAGRGFVGPLSTSQVVAIVLLLGAAFFYFRLKQAVPPTSTPQAPPPPAPAAA
jgi:phosphatidylglycerol:prolipoprotein diacylglycerol transferase